LGLAVLVLLARRVRVLWPPSAILLLTTLFHCGADLFTSLLGSACYTVCDGHGLFNGLSGFYFSFNILSKSPGAFTFC
jgi:hypothetical protein